MSESVIEPEHMLRQFNEESINLFWEFINKRQSIWHRRVVKGESPPWTSDEILRENRFTNIYRRLDPGTQYAIQNILEKDASREDKIFNIMIYRLIGRSSTHETIGFQYLEDFDAVEFEKELKHQRDVENKTIFTGAYMVAGYSQMGSSDKVENISILFDQISSSNSLFEDLLTCKSAKDAYNIIKSQDGFGNFLSYQVLVDLLYSVDYYNGQSLLPFSTDEWSAPGPGAQKGIKRLLKNSTQVDDLDVIRWLRNHQREEFDRLNINFPYLTSKSGEEIELTLADIQNCLCEYYKYDKINQSNGRARRKFRESERRGTEEIRSLYNDAPFIHIIPNNEEDNSD